MVTLYNDERLDFDDVLLIPNNVSYIKSRADVNLEVNFDTKRVWDSKELYLRKTNNISEETIPEISWSGVPIIAANMDNIGTFRVARVLSKYKMLTALTKSHTLEDFKKEEYDPEYICVSGGLSDFDNIASILKYNPAIKWICLDVANGYMKKFHEVIALYREKFPDKFIIAGNVVTKEGANAISNAANYGYFAKIGIGSGGVCTTRSQTGIGYPQFSALLNCSTSDTYYAEGSGEPYSEYWNRENLVSDGGCKNPGDIAKAFAAGAKMVMIGSMLAGYDETGDYIYGMSSKEAIKKLDPNLDSLSYRSSEGKCVKISSYSGRPLSERIEDILGGLRSTLSYTNNHNLTSLITGNNKFIKVRRILNNYWSPFSTKSDF